MLRNEIGGTETDQVHVAECFQNRSKCQYDGSWAGFKNKGQIFEQAEGRER
jgi:hypothetical protein